MSAQDAKRFDPAPFWTWDPARQRAICASSTARDLFPESFSKDENGLATDHPVAALSNACFAALISTGASQYGPAMTCGWRVTCRIEPRQLKRGALGVRVTLTECVREQAPLVGDGPVARAAHDLRTPLSAIIGFAEFMAASGPSMPEEVRRSYLTDIADAGRFASRMALDLLTYTSAGASAPGPVPRADLAENARGAARLLSIEAESLGIDISITAPRSGTIVAADPDQMRRAASNLLGNAVAHADHSVAVTLSPRADGALALTIADDGPGLSEGDLQKALTPFGRLSQGPQDRVGKGVGLGLPIAQRFAELNGAKLEIETAPGAGFSASIVFPAGKVLEPR